VIGVNVDPLDPAGEPSPDALREAGFSWVRLVSRPGVERYVADCQAAGLLVLAVVARESQGYVFGGPDIWQFGNEPDASGPSSWTMSAGDYVAQFAFYQQTYPHLTWIGAGLASGEPTWWVAAMAIQGPASLHMSGFAVHPYNKTAAQAATLLRAYQKVTPALPLWVTEWHRPAVEILPFVSMLRELSVAHAWFCWTDSMVPGFGMTPNVERLMKAAA
jgi:hypothetical protein